MIRFEEALTGETANLPDPSALGVVLAALLTELEGREPGICARLARNIEHNQLKSAVIALRGPRISPKLEVAIAQGSNWMRTAQLFAESVHGPPHFRSKGKKRR